MKTLDKNYWKNRWQRGETEWDAHAPTTPIKDFVDYLAAQKVDKNLRILIPGVGSGHEAKYLLEQGFENIVVLDWAEEAIEKCRRQMPQLPDSQLIVGNFFELKGAFDLILEQTFFCALDPKWRPDYATKCFDLLNTEGSVAGVLFGKIFPFDGPPFGGSEEEYRGYFEPLFTIEKMESCRNSIKPRQGNELWIQLKKRVG